MPTFTSNIIAENDLSLGLQKQVIDAVENQSALFICGGKSKLFYGYPVDGKTVCTSAHTGIIDYEPSELCITVRAGTRLEELEAVLANNQQILPFEPPHYTGNATIGGAIAAGIAGPRRAYSGSVRDAILGVQIINGEGEIVNFGGQVMKNVAGYDLSRLMVRSQGTLGLILSVSLRLLPKPEHNLTLSFEATQDEALDFFKALRVKQLPITATVWHDNQVFTRFSASETVLAQCKLQFTALTKEKNLTETTSEIADSDQFWQGIRDHQHTFFEQQDKPLWRFSLPPSAKKFARLNTEPLIEWGGAQRWIYSNAPANIIQSIASSRQGYATLFKSDLPSIPHFPALEPNLLALHKSLKQKMDPRGIFNPNRIYQGL